MSSHHHEDFEETTEQHELTSQSKWKITKVAHRRQWGHPSMAKTILSVAVMGSLVMGCLALMMGAIFHFTELLSQLPSGHSTLFFGQWAQAFGYWPLKIAAGLSFIGLPFFSYMYLYTFHEDKEGIIDSIGTHWPTYFSVPFLMAISFTTPIILKALGLSMVIQAGAYLPQFIFTACSLAIIYKTYSDKYAQWSGIFMIAAPLALVIEVSKHLVIEGAFASFQAPLMAAAFSLTALVFSWNLVTAYCFSFGAHWVYVQSHWESESPENLCETSFEGLKAIREISVIALAETTKRFLDSKSDTLGVGLEELSELAGVPEERAQYVLDHLEEVGLIKQVVDKYGDMMAVLTSSPDLVSLKAVIDAIEQQHPNISEGHQYAQWFWDEYTKAMNERFEKVSLRDLVEKNSQSFKKVA